MGLIWRKTIIQIICVVLGGIMVMFFGFLLMGGELWG